MASEISPVWEKLKITGSLLATILIPTALAYLGNIYSKDQKEREISLKYVELAIGILRSTPTAETAAIRNWAVEVIDRHATLPLSDKVKDELKLQQLIADLQKNSADMARTPVRNLRE